MRFGSTSRCPVFLRLSDQRQAAEAHALAVARSVDDQTGDAACNQIGNAFEILKLLGDVEAVEEHHRRCGLVARRFRRGGNEQRRQCLVAVRHLDMFDARPLQQGRAVGERLHRFLVGLGGARAVLEEPFADLGVVRRAHQAGGGGQRMALFRLVAAARLDDVAHLRPFLEPGLVIAELVAQGAADAVDLVDLGAAPRCGGQAQQQPHRPAVVAREIDEGRVVFAVAHVSSVIAGLSRRSRDFRANLSSSGWPGQARP